MSRSVGITVVLAMMVVLLLILSATPAAITAASPAPRYQAQASTPTETATATESPTPTETITPTYTLTPTETLSPTNTATLTPTATIQPTGTATPTFTATITPTATSTPEATVTPTATPAQATPSTAINDYVIFGLNSVWLRSQSDVYSGHVGVQDASPGPVLNAGAEVSVGEEVTFHNPYSAIAGDTVKLKWRANTFDIFANELNVDWEATYSQWTSPLSLPLTIALPPLPQINPGATDYALTEGNNLKLAAGAYGDIDVKWNSVLILTGGVYHFNDLHLEDGGRIEITGPTEIRIANRFSADWGAGPIGPAVGSGLDATDLVIFVGGINGASGGLGDAPKAVDIDGDSVITATMYIPNGTLQLGYGVQVTGALIGRDVKTGGANQFWLQSAFAEDYESPLPPPSPPPPPAVIDDYVVFGLNSINFEWDVEVHGGHIGVQDASPGPVLQAGAEIAMDGLTLHNPNSIIAADTVQIDSSDVFDIFYNGLDQGYNLSYGELNTPLGLPLLTNLPDFPEINPGTTNHTVPQSGNLELPAGAYGAIKLNWNSDLILTGGVYHLESLTLADEARLTATAPTEIRIANRLISNWANYIGPDTSLGLDATDLVIFVAGINGSSGNLGATPKAARIGLDNTIRANLYVPNGTLRLNYGTQAWGAFIGRDVHFEGDNHIWLESAFAGGYQSPGFTIADFLATPLTGSVPLTVTFTNSSTNAIDYLWTFGDGTTSTEANPDHTYNQSGVYTVSLTANGPDSSHTLTRTNFITVTGVPELAISKSGPATVLAGELVTYTLTISNEGTSQATNLVVMDTVPPAAHYVNGGTLSGNVVTWTVDSLAINESTSLQFVVTATETITNNDYGVVADGGVSTVGTLTVTTLIDPPVIANFSAFPRSETAPALVQFLNSSTGATDYLWHFGDSLTSTLPSPTHTYTVAGVYTVSLTAIGSNSSHTLTRTNYITVTGVPELIISKAGPATAQASELVTYTLTISNEGTSQATNLVVTDTVPPAAHYVSGGTLSGNVVTWTVASLAANESAAVQFVVTATETITNSDYGVSAGDGVATMGAITVTTLISPPIIANFSAFPRSETAPALVQFLNSSTGATDYLWHFGDNLTSTIPSPTHTYTVAGVYTVSLTASNPSSSHTLTRTNYITVTSLVRDWQQITTTLSPPAVSEHAMAYYDSDRDVVVLYGGNALGWPYENSTWEFDEAAWQLINTSVTPTVRYGAAMAYDHNRQALILFGGGDETDTTLNHTWEYSGTDWSDVSPGTSPSSRTYPGIATNPLSNTIYLFGGNDDDNLFNDLWAYENGTWQEIETTSAPPARTLAALTYDSTQQQLLLFGGRTLSGTLLADLWAFDPASQEWTLLDDGGGGGDPTARQAHTLTYDSATGNAVLIGGTPDGGDTLLGDTWLYQNGWIEATPATSLPPRAYHQAVYTGAGIIVVSQGEVWKYE
jgi:uncharacterized repeat protein (TIGR01451 family)